MALQLFSGMLRIKGPPFLLIPPIPLAGKKQANGFIGIASWIITVFFRSVKQLRASF